MPSFNDNSDFQNLRRHDPYYINGGDIHFLIGRTLFRVHRYFFVRESLFFRNKLAEPASPGRTPQGTEDSNAIMLDVSVVDFERFLWVFYNPKYSLYDTTVEEWSSILSLAHRWVFPEVKSLSVRELEKLTMTAVDRIVLYQKYEVDENLLIPCYAEICSRDTSLTVEEGEQMGIRTAMRLAMARERARATQRDGAKSPLPPDVKEQQLVSLVKDLFDIPVSTTPPAPQGKGHVNGKPSMSNGIPSTNSPNLNNPPPGKKNPPFSLGTAGGKPNGQGTSPVTGDSSANAEDKTTNPAQKPIPSPPTNPATKEIKKADDTEKSTSNVSSPKLPNGPTLPLVDVAGGDPGSGNTSGTDDWTDAGSTGAGKRGRNSGRGRGGR